MVADASTVGMESALDVLPVEVLFHVVLLAGIVTSCRAAARLASPEVNHKSGRKIINRTEIRRRSLKLVEALRGVSSY